MDMMSYLMGRNSGGAKKGAKIEVVTELPETGEANVIYLVPKETEDENNVFDEYLYINDEWELIGTTDIDLSGYQPLLTAGDNITINNNVISANIKLPDVPVLTIYEQYTSNIQTTLQISSANLAIINDFIKKENVTTEKGTNFILDINGSDLEDTNKLYPYRYLVFIKIPKRTGTINTSMAYAYQAICVRIDVWGINENKTILTNSFNTSVNLNENGYVTNFVSVTKTVKADIAFLTEASSLSKSNTTSYTPTGDYNPATKKYVDDSKGQTIQYETMPTASADYLGKIVQYTGTTDANYTNGYFYVCVGTTENDVTTYSWSNVEVQNSDDIFVFVDEDTTGRSVSSLNSIPENKEKLKRLGQVILDGKVPAVFFKRKGYQSSGGTRPIHPTLYYWNVYNDYISFTFEIIYPNRSSSFVYYYDVQYGATQDAQYIATSYPNGTNSSFSSKSTSSSLVPKNVGTEVYRYPISSQYFNWTLDLETYSSSKTYQIGDYVVWYSSSTQMSSQTCKLYKCNTADTTGTWDSSKWDQKTYMEYLSDKLVGGALNGSY